MPIYTYQAKNAKAETIAGEIFADDRDSAVEKISQMGLMPVVIQGKDSVSSKTTAKPAGFFSRRVKGKSLVIFSRQLSSLLRSGVPILRVMDVIGAQVDDVYFRSVIAEMRLEVQGGKSFSDSLAQYPHIFSTLYVTLVRAGEESGQLAETIRAMSNHLKKQQEIAVKVRSALVYPAFMFVFGIGTIVFLLTSVMPRITDLFSDLQQNLPAITKFVWALSDGIVKWWAWLLLVFLIIWGLTLQWLKTETGKRAISSWALSVPFLKTFCPKVDFSRFCRTAAMLLKSGNSLVRAVPLALPVVGNMILAEELEKCHEDLLAGKSFGQSLARSKFITPMVGQMVSVGEESGGLVEALDDVAQQYEEELDESVKVMTTLIEPLLIVLVGGVIGFLVAAMVLPIFQMDMFVG